MHRGDHPSPVLSSRSHIQNATPHDAQTCDVATTFRAWPYYTTASAYALSRDRGRLASLVLRCIDDGRPGVAVDIYETFIQPVKNAGRPGTHLTPRHVRRRAERILRESARQPELQTKRQPPTAF